MIVRIATLEQLDSVVHTGQGYLYNDFGGRDPRYCPIHRVGTCNQIGRMLAVRPGALSVKKLWSDQLAELIGEVERLGKVHSMCGAETGAPKPARRVAPGRPTVPAKHELIVEADHLRIWSVERLAYEPRGAMRQVRDDLARAVRGLAAGEDKWLHSTLSSAGVLGADPENVLIYNVGPRHFAHLTREGLRFEHIVGPLPSPARDPGLGFHHDYRVARASDEPVAWQVTARLASWEDARLDQLDEFTSAGEVWLAIHNATLRSFGTPSLAHFGVNMTLSVPSGRVTSAAQLVKPVVDGAVAAFHRHDGTALQDLAGRLARRWTMTEKDCRTLLMDSTHAVLGTRRLLWAWKDGVQWNPDDERCVHGVLRLVPSREERWVLRGEIVGLEKKL
jgi:hypothetical protein